MPRRQYRIIKKKEGKKSSQRKKNRIRGWGMILNLFQKMNLI